MARPNFGGRFLDFMDGVVAGSAVESPVDLSLTPRGLGPLTAGRRRATVDPPTCRFRRPIVARSFTP